MTERVKAIRAFGTPYAPGLHVVAAELRPHTDWVDPRPVFVAGKGYSEADAVTRMLGEATERDAILKRLGDESRPLMNAGGRTIGTVAAGTDVALTADRALPELLSVEVETSDLAHAQQTGQTVARETARGLMAARQAAFETTHRDLFGDGPAGPPKFPKPGSPSTRSSRTTAAAAKRSCWPI